MYVYCNVIHGKMSKSQNNVDNMDIIVLSGLLQLILPSQSHQVEQN